MGKLKQFNIAYNQEFLIWYDRKIQGGYCPFLSVSELQEIVDDIYGCYTFGSKDLNSLISTFSENKRLLVLGNYRGNSKARIPIINNGLVVRYVNYIYIPVKHLYMFADNYCDTGSTLVIANEDGMVHINSLIELGCNFKESILLDDLSEILKGKEYGRFISTEIDKAVMNHSIDLEIRTKLFELIYYKLRCSNAYNGNFFIKEFNNLIPNLALTMKKVKKF